MKLHGPLQEKRQSSDRRTADRLDRTRFYLLADHPRVGRARDDLLAGARSFPVGNYVIVNPIDGEDVQAAGDCGLIRPVGRFPTRQIDGAGVPDRDV